MRERKTCGACRDHSYRAALKKTGRLIFARFADLSTSNVFSPNRRQTSRTRQSGSRCRDYKPDDRRSRRYRAARQLGKILLRLEQLRHPWHVKQHRLALANRSSMHRCLRLCQEVRAYCLLDHDRRLRADIGPTRVSGRVEFFVADASSTQPPESQRISDAGSMMSAMSSLLVSVVL